MNKKGFYNDNNDWTKKIKEFFKESGFYILIVVGLCILAVGSVYFTTNHLLTAPDEPEDQLVQDEPGEEPGNQIVILDDQPDLYEESAVEQLQNPESRWEYGAMIDSPVVDVKPPQTEDNDQPVDEPEVEDEPGIETSANPTLAPSPTKAQEKPSQKAEAEDDSKEVINLFGSKPTFMMPVEGKIGMDYAMDRLLYSKTLDEWRTHSGFDITAPRGEVVKAVADGYVKEIKEDPCYGITIILDHENGYKSVYSNLASKSMVSINQKVKAGDAISSVGNTAVFECMDPPHLHYEIYKDDKLIDPKSVLPMAKE